MGKDKKVICITGPAGAGKTTLTEYLKDKGYHIINVDSLGHKALEIVKESIIREFGDVLDAKGHIDRNRLKLHLSTPDDWEKLEKITHPVIRKLLKEEILESKSDKIIVDAAIPFKLKIDKLCDVIIKITAPSEILIHRLKERGMTESFIQEILRRQENEFKEPNHWDFVINNDGELQDFLKTALSIIEQL